MKKLQLLFLSTLATFGVYAEPGITMTTGAAAGSEIRFLVNTSSATQPVTVDFGDGEPTYFTIDPSQIQSNRWISGTLKGQTIRVSGNITEFSCEEQGLTAVSVEGMTKLEVLELSKNQIEDFEFVDRAPVRVLELNDNRLWNSPSVNANLTLDKVGETLTDLNLSSNPELGCIHLGALVNLEYLTANDCEYLSSVFICSPDESHEKLRSIKLNNCDLAHFYPVDLPALRTLELANNSLVSGSMDTDPFVLGDYPNLRVLDVSGNTGISELDVTVCPLLEKLHAGDCSLSAIDVAQCPELNTLSLANNRITSLDLGNNKELGYLYVSNNPIKKIDFEKLLKIEGVDISGTQISRVNLYYCYYLKSFNASNTKLEFVDFNAQQSERMQLIDLRDCPGFTPMSMAYTVKTLPVARTTQSSATSLYLAGSHPEIADIAYVTNPDMHWICDSQGDGSADYPVVSATVEDATLTGERKTGHLDRLYPYGGLSLDYALDEYSTDGGKFLLVQWEPEWFQSVTSITNNLRRGVPVCVYTYPDEGKQFKSVTVNGKEIMSDWFIVDEAASIKVNFEDRESSVVLGSETGRTLSFSVATTKPNGTIEIDWGSGSRTTYTDITAYQSGHSDIDAVGTRIDGKAAGENVTIYGDIAAVNISCYGEYGEEEFGLPNNRINAVNTSNCPGLKLLNLYFNPVGSLDLSANKELEMLDASYTAISSLDLKENSKLFYLVAYGNSDGGEGFAQFDNIDLSGLASLRVADLHNQKLTTLDVSKNPLLTALNVTNNHIGALDLSNNPQLVQLRASRNNLSTLDLTANSRLTEVILDNNSLGSLDLSHNTALEELSVANNAIKALDTHMLPELGKLYVNGNGLTADQLNDIYYLLPERKHRDADDDPMSVKFNLFANQAGDVEANDGEGADGSIAVARKWLPNPNGTNSGSATSYFDIIPADGGTVTVTDASGKTYVSGDKIKKYTTLTVTAVPAEGYEYLGFSLNGDEPMTGKTFLMPGIYTMLQPVFSNGAGVDEVAAENVAVYVDAAGNIVVDGAASAITVYAVDGRTVVTAKGTGSRTVVASPGAGTYIVRADGVKTIIKTIVVK